MSLKWSESGNLSGVRAALAGAALAGALGAAGCAIDEEGDETLDEATAPAAARPRVGTARGDAGAGVAAVYEYLRAYGYFPNPALEVYAGWRPAFDAPADPRVFDAALEAALVAFQERNGLPADGTLNAETAQLMAQPRCGFPDVGLAPGGAEGFVASGTKWGTKTLSYRFANYTPDLATSTIQTSIGGAFGQWAGVGGFTFSSVTSGGDIVISFAAGDHGDGYPFDGPSGVLAHAFYPTNGDAHFDEDETWTTNGTGIDLATVAIHELGHSLGLAHSDVSTAVMAPYYTGIKRDLTADDILGIQTIYLAPPNPIHNYSERCRGLNTVTWTAQPNATTYQLWRSFSSSFTSPTLIYSGSDTDQFINVGQGSTWYMRAKACTSAGCSDYSSQVSATYWTGICQ